MRNVTVALNERSYDILIEQGSLHASGDFISKLPVNKNLAIISNETVAPLYLPALKKSLLSSSCRVHEIILPDGEQYKSLSRIESIHEALLSFDLDRQSPLVALGGGVVGDITGFAASTFLRGVPFIQIPTTLLAQVDSSVGGKTGVNLPGGKNMVGTFYQPSLVIIDPDVLKTLDAREMLAGLAEVIKYGVILDEPFFRFLEQDICKARDLDIPTLTNIIETCCRLKASVTAEDETERGIRAYLNFGHTIGHAIETITGYTDYIHGEAVAMGMVAAARLSQAWDFCTEEACRRVETLLDSTGLPTGLPPFPAETYVNIMQRDKKKSGSHIRMVLMRSIGEVFLETLSRERLTAALDRTFDLPEKTAP